MNRDSANESGTCSGPGSNTNAPVAPATASASAAIPLPPPLPPAPRPRQAPPAAIDLLNLIALNESDPSFDERTAITMSLSSGKTLMSEPPATPPVPSFPCRMFFYGSLMDPEILQTILGVETAPPFSKCSIAGFKVKIWSIYPTLIPSNGGRVNGVVCTIASETLFWRLVAYETEAYTWCRCRAILHDGSRLAADKAKEKQEQKELVQQGQGKEKPIEMGEDGECYTFCWAGSPDSKELEGGDFDFERYKKYFKPLVVRRRE